MVVMSVDIRVVVAGLLTAAVVLTPAVAQADPEGQMYGDPGAAAQYWRYQHQQDCGLMAVADVVGQITGREPLQAGVQLRGATTKSGVHDGTIYHFNGTAPEDLVLILKQFGVASEYTSGNSITVIENDLAAGRKLIATVNAATLWNQPRGQRTDVDHAVVVTGVDTRTDTVHLNDSGIPTGRDEQVPLAVFAQSWATGGNALIVA